MFRIFSFYLIHFFTLWNAFAFLLVPPCGIPSGPLPAQVPNPAPSGYQTTAYVSRIIAGDTFVLSDSQHVCLLGINAPELNSSDSLQQFIALSSKLFLDSLICHAVVKLTFESTTRDIFGRVLAYVWLTDKSGTDSLFIQAELLKKGYGRIRNYPQRSRYYHIFYNLRRTAMRKNLGLWSR